MKKLTGILCILFFFLMIGIHAQGPGDPPPPPSGGHGSTGNQPAGGGAPVGNGMLILPALAIGYGIKKIYDHRKKKLLD